MDQPKKPSPQKMWATYNFGVLWGIGYTRKQSRERALEAAGHSLAEWPRVKDMLQSYKVTVTARAEEGSAP